ncbi:MAG: hypothetical protein J6K90_00770, partial [Tidjanibacter sp.]|nr:hypothetical protein [Tidjanibacter sp.]
VSTYSTIRASLFSGAKIDIDLRKNKFFFFAHTTLISIDNKNSLTSCRFCGEENRNNPCLRYFCMK